MQLSSIHQKILVIAPRILLGAIFLWASWEKILYPKEFAKAIQNYMILPDMLVNWAALILPWIEAVCGILLISGYWIRGSSLIIVILMIIFIIALAVSIFRGLDINCGCFSLKSDKKHSMYLYLVRDFSFLGLGIWVLYGQWKKDRAA